MDSPTENPKYRKVFESLEYATYLEHREYKRLPSLPDEVLYKRFLKARRQNKYREKKRPPIYIYVSNGTYNNASG